MWTKSTSSKNTGEPYPFFLGFGSRKTILMENTGEQTTAGEVAGRRRLFLRLWECAGGHLFYWDQDFSFSGWTCQKYAQIYTWGFLPSLFERLILLSFLVAFCWTGYNEKNDSISTSKITILWTMDSLGIVISWQSWAMNYGMLHLGENTGKSLRGKDLDSARMSKSKQYFTLIKHIWQV